MGRTIEEGVPKEGRRGEIKEGNLGDYRGKFVKKSIYMIECRCGDVNIV